MDVPTGADAVHPGRWYAGQVFVHVKDQVTQPSMPWLPSMADGSHACGRKLPTGMILLACVAFCAVIIQLCLKGRTAKVCG
jgi:hypothetical protein